MHSIGRYGANNWQVFRCEIGLSNQTIHQVLFQDISFDSAIKLVNFLNGGDEQFSPNASKVLEYCFKGE